MEFRNKIATSSHILSLYPVHEAIEILGKIGYHAIEIWAAELEQQKSGLTSIPEIKKVLKDFSMTGVIHCPLRDLSSVDKPKLNICSKNKDWREKSIQENLLALEHAFKLDFKVITVHPGHTDLEDEEADDEYWELQIDAFRKIAKRAEELDLKIGMEPMEKRPKEFVMNPTDVDRIIKAVNSRNLGVTFDLIHAYTHGVDRPIEFLDSLRKDIFHIHVSGHNKQKNHVPFSMTEIPSSYLDKVLKKVIDYHKDIVSIEGSLNGIIELTKANQKEVVEKNYDYLSKELKSLHLL